MKRTAIRRISNSPTAECKIRIQALLRQIVINRDGGCVFRGQWGIPICNGYRADGQLILQFDNLNTRARNISYGDPRLGVCVCKGHHGWKNWSKDEYDRLVIKSIGPERAGLLERVKADNRSYPMGLHEWLVVEIALKAELGKVCTGRCYGAIG
jgi:hypothetical protein